ncbi:hypothetical protein EYM_05810 [Ignicoccus islandicus DSM 13165]|uniref:Uncharacterized protein n=1 Tax=Ignicoccus islandicus DSM 13165 TaxID=940295 RepID=A0A0U3FT50_9CREN|nr:hypothetical protein EYM_05810 [Ignicoccus islandicus DSM 13165]
MLIMLLQSPFALKFTVTIENNGLLWNEEWGYEIYLTIDGKSVFSTSYSVNCGWGSNCFVTHTFPDASCGISGQLVVTETNYFYGTIVGDVLNFEYSVTTLGVNRYQYMGESLVLGRIGFVIENYASEPCVKTSPITTPLGEGAIRNVPVNILLGLGVIPILTKLKEVKRKRGLPNTKAVK